MGQSDLSYALARVLSKNYTVIGWTTHGHNGETVPVWIHGADAPVGIIDNTDLATIAADAMEMNLDRATMNLYVDLDNVTDAYTIEDDGLGNLTLTVAGAELPISKDFMKIEKKNGKEKIVQLPGLTVYAPATGKVYVAKKALRLLGIN
jgi:alkaline phosphatase